MPGDGWAADICLSIVRSERAARITAWVSINRLSFITHSNGTLVVFHYSNGCATANKRKKRYKHKALFVFRFEKKRCIRSQSEMEEGEGDTENLDSEP